MPIIIGSFYFYGDDDMLRSVEHHRQIIAALQARRQCAALAVRFHLAATHLLFRNHRRARPSRRRHDASARARDGIALLMSHSMSSRHAPARRPVGARGPSWTRSRPGHPLTPEERERANAFAHDADRRDFIAAHRLVRAMRLDHRRAARTIVLRQRCDTCGGPHGRPTLPDHPGLHVSLSHAKASAACGDRPVGIDLERWNASQPDHSDLDFALAPAERKRLQSMAASGADADAPSRPPRWPSAALGAQGMPGETRPDHAGPAGQRGFLRLHANRVGRASRRDAFRAPGPALFRMARSGTAGRGRRSATALSISIRSVKAPAARDSPGARRPAASLPTMPDCPSPAPHRASAAPAPRSRRAARPNPAG